MAKAVSQEFGTRLWKERQRLLQDYRASLVRELHEIDISLDRMRAEARDVVSEQSK
ncbi:MAG: hypothetical protein AB7J35_09810 [Dehalococcoidia bacterium]